MKMERATNKHLGELLIERGVIIRAQLDAALDHQKEHKGVLIGEALIALGYATEEDIAQALTCQYGFPYLPLANYEIDPEVVASVPGNICVQFCLIPIDKVGNNITLAMANPLNVQAIENIELLSGCTVQIFVSTLSDVRAAIQRYYGSA